MKMIYANDAPFSAATRCALCSFDTFDKIYHFLLWINATWWNESCSHVHTSYFLKKSWARCYFQSINYKIEKIIFHTTKCNNSKCHLPLTIK
jgi:hypothetical protein